MANRKTEPELIRYFSQKDFEIVRDRIPEEYCSRLRDVFVDYTTNGGKNLGWTTRRGRRDIVLCSILPQRVSLGRFLVKRQSALEFGTLPRGQWTPWAVRRFLLYDVFLHEIGHLQIVNAKKSDFNRKFASESKAQEFADNLRRKLWSEYFEHPDPIHNKPQEDELSIIPLWQKLDKRQRFNLVSLAVRAPYKDLPDLSQFGEIEEIQMKFLVRALVFESSK